MTYWLTLLVAMLMALAIGASIYLLIESLITGSITTNNRGPRSTYTLALQPRRFWFEFVWQSLCTSFLLAACVFGLWIYRKVLAPLHTPKRKRRTEKA